MLLNKLVAVGLGTHRETLGFKIKALVRIEEHWGKHLCTVCLPRLHI